MENNLQIREQLIQGESEAQEQIDQLRRGLAAAASLVAAAKAKAAIPAPD